MMMSLLLLLFYCLTSTYLKDLSIDFQVYSLLFILINSVVLIFTLTFNIRNKKYYIMIVVGYFLRTSALLWDIYFRSIFILPHSGSDTEGFYRQGMAIANDFSLFNKMPMGPYTNFLGLLFRVIGDQRIIAQYINVMLGMGIIVTIYKIMEILQFESKIKYIILLLVILFPQAIIFSGILLRENLVSFSIILMTYYLIKWYKFNGRHNIVLTFIWYLIATYFHSGFIGAFLPLIFIFAFYERKTDSLNINIKSFILLILFAFIAVIIYMKFGEILFSKFGGKIDFSSKDIYKSISIEGLEVGSRYLEWINYNSIFDIVIFAPLKVFYFMFSPIPFDWRGVMDIVTFTLDSFIYLAICLSIFRNRKNLNTNIVIVNILISIFVIVAFTFAYGTIAAGTAVRHRNKIYGLLLIIYGIFKSQNVSTNSQTRVV